MVGIARPGHWSALGGGCDPGEMPADAIVRELAEEAGLVVTDLAELFEITDEHGSGQRLTFDPAVHPRRSRQGRLGLTTRPSNIACTTGVALSTLLARAICTAKTTTSSRPRPAEPPQNSRPRSPHRVRANRARHPHPGRIRRGLTPCTPRGGPRYTSKYCATTDAPSWPGGHSWPGGSSAWSSEPFCCGQHSTRHLSPYGPGCSPSACSPTPWPSSSRWCWSNQRHRSASADAPRSQQPDHHHPYGHST
ncbi:NUDIX domain-containing protein [Streptomyces sp. NPDC050418]|uniref:NUDIX domain-containing protein n=1 Tax=Streptomyces sp. NPDC050418 TaxID=3365612 RepID=UPI0037A1B474